MWFGLNEDSQGVYILGIDGIIWKCFFGIFIRDSIYKRILHHFAPKTFSWVAKAKQDFFVEFEEGSFWGCSDPPDAEQKAILEWC